MSASILNRIMLLWKWKREVCGYIPLFYTSASYKNWWLTELSFYYCLTVRPVKLMNGYFLSFFVASRIPKISNATNANQLNKSNSFGNKPKLLRITKNVVIRWWTIPTWSPKIKEHRVGIMQHQLVPRCILWQFSEISSYCWETLFAK